MPIITDSNILISKTQTGFLQGRSIGENTRFIHDLIERLNVDNKSGKLILLNFEKAFDSLEWNFIVKTLAFFELVYPLLIDSLHHTQIYRPQS